MELKLLVPLLELEPDLALMRAREEDLVEWRRSVEDEGSDLVEDLQGLEEWKEEELEVL